MALDSPDSRAVAGTQPLSFAPNCGAAEALLALPKFGTGVGLHRMLWILDKLPHASALAQIDAIKVTGSKGKGSTSSICAAILGALGFRTGLFTSPHLFRWNERVKIEGSDISDAALTAAWSWFAPHAETFRKLHPGDGFCAFEGFTAVALYAFTELLADNPSSRCAFVAEGGIGGRYDSTRVIPGKTVSLTTVELEHTALLGDAEELIAYDKADLAPSGGTLVCGPLSEPLMYRLSAYARVRNVSVVRASDGTDISDIRHSAHGSRFSLRLRGLDFGTLELSLPGVHQIENAVVAISTVLRWLEGHGGVESTAFIRAVHSALARVCWPGRMQKVHDEPPVYVDVGHTPDSMRRVAETIGSLAGDRPVILLTGVSKDKNIRGILEELLPAASVVYCSAATHKGADPAVVAQTASACGPDLECRVFSELSDAVAHAVERARTENMCVLVAGGLFLAIEALACLRGYDPRTLHFA